MTNEEKEKEWRAHWIKIASGLVGACAGADAISKELAKQIATETDFIMEEYAARFGSAYE